MFLTVPLLLLFSWVGKKNLLHFGVWGHSAIPICRHILFPASRPIYQWGHLCSSLLFLVKIVCRLICQSVPGFLHQFPGSFYSHIKSKRVVCITGEKFCFFLKFQKSNDEHQHLSTPFLQTEKIRIQTEQPKTLCPSPGVLEHCGNCSCLACCFGDKP